MPSTAAAMTPVATHPMLRMTGPTVNFPHYSPVGADQHHHRHHRYGHPFNTALQYSALIGLMAKARRH
jgi:hypothetical protein